MTVIMGYFINAAEYYVQRFLLPWEYLAYTTPMRVCPKIHHSLRIAWYTSGFQ